MSAEIVTASCAYCRRWPCACPPVRIEPCECGGEIYAVAGQVAEAVGAHVRTEQHRAWRTRVGLLAIPGPAGAIVGPCLCRTCGAPVWWVRDAWANRFGDLHRCAIAEATA